MRTWFLPPDFTYAADGPLQLGTVIADPSKPTQVIATLSSPGTGVTLPETGVLVEPNHAHDRSGARSNAFRIFAQFFAVVSASLGIDVGSNTALSYSNVDHEIRSFKQPLTAETAMKIVSLPIIKEHMDSGRWSKRPVYVVSALRIAKTSFTVKSETGKNFGLELSGFGPPFAGPVPLELGGGVSHSREKRATDSYDTAPDIVFAYRVHVVRYKRAGIEAALFESNSAFMTESERADEEAPIVVEGTKQELDMDREEQREYTVAVIDKHDVCISFQTEAS
jgi:hypothetical protein